MCVSVSKHRAEVCEALNVTVTPGPVTMCREGDNVTLSCQVSQMKRPSSLLVVRWVFSREAGEEHLIVKLNMRKAKYYGNYTKRFASPKLRLSEEEEGKAYNLQVLNVSREDGGRYACKVQEIRKHRNRWRASSNGTATTELKGQRKIASREDGRVRGSIEGVSTRCGPGSGRGTAASSWPVRPAPPRGRLQFLHVLPAAENRDGIWRLFEDVYLCAVLICSVGLVCMLLFLVVITCQYLQRKQRLKASYYLVKSPQNSSGETVTSVISSSPSLPRKEKKYKHTSKESPSKSPPDLPAKVPMGDKMRRPKLIKVQPRKVVLPKITEENLTYAELELVKPQPENKTACSGTVYAQILFEEKQV
ncbi:hypothetical protein JZ751_019858 [Albula glossodonta]|uniref:Ig-like domain-containing protein n=1 Tax=Albula glossodonta TaxID=121402 RepID=A0A8T2NM37_9TELE|nr:hypothetical protein JZ751_019858 [Albula glossodonta]